VMSQGETRRLPHSRGTRPPRPRIR
jgi:hypothetical protein